MQNKEFSGPPIEGGEGGGWGEEVHETLYPGNFNRGLAEYISIHFERSSILEFGSGLGFLARHVSENGNVDTYHCIEPREIKGQYRKGSAPELFVTDIFRDDVETLFLEKYDLVCSIEVAEHIPLSDHKVLFDFLVSKSQKWIVFSGATIGQGGHGHISERSEGAWRREFMNRGCFLEEEHTGAIRQACDEKNINHRKNLMVFSVPG